MALMSFGLAFTGALMPGPMFAVTVSMAPRKGFWFGPLLVLGHAIAESLLIIALAWGLAELIQNRIATGLLGLIGGVVLIWMAVGMIRSSGALTLKPSEVKPQRIQDNPVTAGFLTSIFNPYWVLWWVGPGLAFMTKSVGEKSLPLLIFFVGHIQADLLWFSFLSLSFSLGRNFLSDKIYRWIVRLCAVFLIYIGGSFVYFGLEKFKEW